MLRSQNGLKILTQAQKCNLIFVFAISKILGYAEIFTPQGVFLKILIVGFFLKNFSSNS
jgi:hypothetical protein